MEFYPDELTTELYEAAIALSDNVESEIEQSVEEQPAWLDGRPQEQREAEVLNHRVMGLWPEEWEATRHMSEKSARKHRRALRARLMSIDEKNAWNTGRKAHPRENVR